MYYFIPPCCVLLVLYFLYVLFCTFKSLPVSCGFCSQFVVCLFIGSRAIWVLSLLPYPSHTLIHPILGVLVCIIHYANHQFVGVPWVFLFIFLKSTCNRTSGPLFWCKGDNSALSVCIELITVIYDLPSSSEDTTLCGHDKFPGYLHGCMIYSCRPWTIQLLLTLLLIINQKWLFLMIYELLATSGFINEIPHALHLTWLCTPTFNMIFWSLIAVSCAILQLMNLVSACIVIWSQMRLLNTIIAQFCEG